MKPFNVVKLVGTLTLLVLLAAYTVAKNAKPTITVPIRPPLPTKNGFDLLTAATNKMVQTEEVADNFNRKPKRQRNLAEKRALVAANQEALSRMKDSLKYPYVEENHHLSWNDPEHPYAKVREMRWLIKLAGSVAWEEGNKADAVNYYLDGLAIGRRMPQHVGIEARDHGIIFESIARRELWDHLELIDTNLAASALKRMEALESDKMPLWESLEEEKYSKARMTLQFIEHPEQVHFDSDSDKKSTEDAKDQDQGSGPSYISIVPHKYIIDSINTYYDKWIAQAKKPYIDGNEEIPEPKELIASTSMPDQKNIRERYTANEAGDALLRTALALRIYQARNGKLPADLKELVAANLLTQVPEDPFAKPGKSLQYKPQEKGKYLLYSIGPDGIDDNGKGTEYVSTGKTIVRFANVDSKGDMVVGWYPY